MRRQLLIVRCLYASLLQMSRDINQNFRVERNVVITELVVIQESLFVK